MYLNFIDWLYILNKYIHKNDNDNNSTYTCWLKQRNIFLFNFLLLVFLKVLFFQNYFSNSWLFLYLHKLDHRKSTKFGLFWTRRRRKYLSQNTSHLLNFYVRERFSIALGYPGRPMWSKEVALLFVINSFFFFFSCKGVLNWVFYFLLKH